MINCVINYNYYGHQIKQTIDLVELVKQMNPAQKVSTAIELLTVIKNTDTLEPHQVAVLKSKLLQVKEQLNWINE